MWRRLRGHNPMRCHPYVEKNNWSILVAMMVMIVMRILRHLSEPYNVRSSSWRFLESKPQQVLRPRAKDFALSESQNPSKSLCASSLRSANSHCIAKHRPSKCEISWVWHTQFWCKKTLSIHSIIHAFRSSNNFDSQSVDKVAIPKQRPRPRPPRQRFLLEDFHWAAAGHLERLMPPCAGIAQGGNPTGISLVNFTMLCLQVCVCLLIEPHSSITVPTTQTHLWVQIAYGTENTRIAWLNNPRKICKMLWPVVVWIFLWSWQILPLAKLAEILKCARIARWHRPHFHRCQCSASLIPQQTYRKTRRSLGLMESFEKLDWIAGLHQRANRSWGSWGSWGQDYFATRILNKWSLAHDWEARQLQ